MLIHMYSHAYTYAYNEWILQTQKMVKPQKVRRIAIVHVQFLRCTYLLPFIHVKVFSFGVELCAIPVSDIHPLLLEYPVLRSQFYNGK